MPKSVKICLAAVIAAVVASVIAAVVLMRPKDEKSSKNVEIVLDNKVIYTFDLNKESDRTFRIEADGGWNDVTIKDGEISVSDADCPDRTCVKTGVLRHEYLPIICLPHKLVIRFCEGEA